MGDINSRLQDNLTGMWVIRSFGQEMAELDRFAAVSAAYYPERVRAIRNWSTSNSWIRRRGFATPRRYGPRRAGRVGSF